VFQITQSYLAQYFQIVTDTLPCFVSKNMSPTAFRKREETQQLNATYNLDSIIKPLKPKDAVAVIGLTTFDIYPNEDWNYVFGLARLTQGVGVWSLNRLGANDQGFLDRTLLLNRTLKVAAHETGHMLGITHCIKNHCCMNGSNSLQESDKQPEWLCWECLAKLCWNRNKPPQQHLNGLLQFHSNITKDTAAIAYYKKAIALLQ
jgi:archaemetzincin